MNASSPSAPRHSSISSMAPGPWAASAAPSSACRCSRPGWRLWISRSPDEAWIPGDPRGVPGKNGQGNNDTRTGWLVVFRPTPLKNLSESQLGWWFHSQHDGKVVKFHGSRPPTSHVVVSCQFPWHFQKSSSSCWLSFTSCSQQAVTACAELRCQWFIRFELWNMGLLI